MHQIRRFIPSPSLWAAIAAMFCITVTVALAAFADEADDFHHWLGEVRAQALQQGIKAPVVDEALGSIAYDEKVVELDNKQPENKITLAQYLNNTINARRIRIGREMLAQHHAVLQRIARQYHVQPRFIVALWGIESDYGQHPGNFSVVQSLATLAYEGRRRDFFTNELINALQILEHQRMNASEMTGSWAGAMGGCQFMPSTYLHYAADGNGDGRKDIWHSEADVFASIANYLHQLGWQDNAGWGTEVPVPDNFSESDTSITHGHTVKEWIDHGIAVPTKAALGDDKSVVYAIYAGASEDGLYLVTENYRAILQWNRSRYFATAVGMLADKIGE